MPADIKTRMEFSLFLIRLIKPKIKAIIPVANPESMDKPTPGLITMSLKMLSPDGTDA